MTQLFSSTSAGPQPLSHVLYHIPVHSAKFFLASLARLHQECMCACACMDGCMYLCTCFKLELYDINIIKKIMVVFILRDFLSISLDLFQCSDTCNFFLHFL